jgi:hypothetical protein
VARYSDRHSLFRINPVEPANGATTTPFGRALEGLEIEAIHARTPPAKGRVERANQTLQDRLVKALRLRGLSDLDSANAYLPAFMADFNPRFAVAPSSAQDAHRPLLHSPRALDLLLSEPRTGLPSHRPVGGWHGEEEVAVAPPPGDASAPGRARP